MFQIELYEQSNIAHMIAMTAHLTQSRGNEPYINHPLRVSEACNNIWYDPYATVAGILHDVLEDSHFTEETLLLLGIDPDVVDVVNLVTREEGISREEYITRLIESGNVHAIRVKLMDAIDNSVWSYADHLRYGVDNARWMSNRLYYRRLALKLWDIYVNGHTDAHAPDEDFNFIKRVIFRWNTIDAISNRLIEGLPVPDSEIDMRMLEVISDITYPQSSIWIEDEIKLESSNETI